VRGRRKCPTTGRGEQHAQIKTLEQARERSVAGEVTPSRFLFLSLSPLHLRLERLTCLSVGHVRVDHFFNPPCACVSE
jgi:hypothetical protein